MKKKFLHPYQVFTIFGLVFLVSIFISSFVQISFTKTNLAFLFVLFLLLASALLNFVLKNKILILLSWALIIFVSSVAFYSYSNQKFEYTLEAQEYTISGTVINNPEFSDKNQKIEVDTKIEGIKQKILVYAPKYPKLLYGDQIEVTGVVEEPKNFEDFNYQNYLKPKGIKYIIMKPGSVVLRGHDVGWVSKSMGFLYKTTNTMTMSLKKVLPDPEAGLASGLVFGGKESLPENFTENLKKTGLTHIVALSGYNVTIIFEIISLLLIVRVGRRRSFLISLALLVFFVLMTGASSSVLRASVFIVVVQLARLLGRKPDRLNVLLFTAVLMLLFNPLMLVYDMSFQLSFLAFIGILYFTPWVDFLLLRRFKTMPDFLRLVLTQTLSAQLAVLPLLIASFGLVSIIAPLTNVLVLWIIPLAMGLSFVTSILALIYLPLAKISVMITWPVLVFIKQVVNFFASIPFSAFMISKLFAPLILLIYLAIFLYHKIKKVKITSYEYELEHGKLGL